MIPRMNADWRRVAKKIPARVNQPRKVTVVTGTLAAPVLAPLAERLARVENLDVRIAPIRNDFFGETVTVAGLLTGQDIAAQLRDRDLGDEVLLPSVAVRDEWLLDDWTLPQLSAALGAPIRVVKPLAADFAEAVLGEDW